jgi:hypothetical protein
MHRVLPVAAISECCTSFEALRPASGIRSVYVYAETYLYAGTHKIRVRLMHS